MKDLLHFSRVEVSLAFTHLALFPMQMQVVQHNPFLFCLLFVLVLSLSTLFLEVPYTPWIPGMQPFLDMRPATLVVSSG